MNNQSKYQMVLNALRACRTENEHLTATNEHLRARLEVMQEENAKLRQKLRESCRESRQLKTALDAAHYLVLSHLAGDPTSRDECIADGMPRSHWYWGRALLMDSRVHNGREFVTNNADEINAAISRSLSRYRVQGLLSMRIRNRQLEWN